MENSFVTKFNSIEVITKSVKPVSFTEGEIFLTDINVKCYVNDKEKEIAYFVSTIIKKQQDNTECAKAELCFRIGVQNFEEFFPSTDSKIPMVEDTVLRGICISSMRGYMFGMLADTRFRHCIVPMINPSAFTNLYEEDKKHFNNNPAEN